MKISHILEGLKDPKDNPCWTGYHPVGTKKKNGKTVPNCVPNTNEAFDQPYKTKGDVDMSAKLPDGTKLSIMFNYEGHDEWQVEFYRNNSQAVTGEGDAQRIFATVIAAIQKFVKKQKPKVVRFSASTLVEPGQNSHSRAKLYDRLIQRYAGAMGYKATADDYGDEISYELTPLTDVSEAFDKPYKSKWEKSDYGDVDVLAKLPDGTNLSIMFNHEGDDEWQVEFYRNNSQEVTGEGDAQRIFATVLNAIQKFVKKHKPAVLKFTASKEVGLGQNNQSRAKLYDRLVQRYAHAMGYEAYQEDHGVGVVYELTRMDTGTSESLEETYDGDEFYEAYGDLWYNEDDQLDEAEYHGHKVPLGKPMQGDVKKFKVYVKNPSGNIVKVNFGDPNMRIKKSNPARRRSFRARHHCENPGPRTKARYWSCRKW